MKNLIKVASTFGIIIVMILILVIANEIIPFMYLKGFGGEMIKLAIFGSASYGIIKMNDKVYNYINKK